MCKHSPEIRILNGPLDYYCIGVLMQVLESASNFRFIGGLSEYEIFIVNNKKQHSKQNNAFLGKIASFAPIITVYESKFKIQNSKFKSKIQNSKFKRDGTKFRL